LLEDDDSLNLRKEEVMPLKENKKVDLDVFKSALKGGGL